MSKLICNERPSAEALKQMKASPYSFPDTLWAAYQNHDMGHPGLRPPRANGRKWRGRGKIWRSRSVL
jgi:hypothetical protein